MKKIFLLPIFTLLLGSCITFGVTPQPFPVWTAIPSRTPSVITATPLVLSPTIAVIPATNTLISTETPTQTATIPLTSPPVQSVDVEILGCNTSIDITHSMGEVTNAYVTVKNTGGVDLPNTCSLLRAIDEDREHPDKKACVPNLPVQNQVTFKLTVDSAYQQDTIIQVDTLSNDVILLRVDKQSCLDIGLFGGAPTDTGMVKPIQ
jgi:hypothetical protein